MISEHGSNDIIHVVFWSVLDSFDHAIDKLGCNVNELVWLSVTIDAWSRNRRNNRCIMRRRHELPFKGWVSRHLISVTHGDV